MIGTNKITLERIKNNQLKLTNLKSNQKHEKEKNLFLNILKTIGIIALSTALGFLGQAWAEPALLTLGFSEVFAATGASVIGTSLEFGSLMGFDALEGEVNGINTVLNFLVFAKILKVFSSSKKMEKVLIEAKEWGILKEWGVAPKSVKTWGDLLKKLNGRKIAVNGTIHDFSKGIKKQDILKLFSEWTFGKATTKIPKLEKSIFASNLEDLVKFQNLLLGINSSLFPKVEKVHFKEALNFLRKEKIKPKDLLNDKLFSQIIFTFKNSTGKVSANIIWAFYSLRISEQLNGQLSNVFLKFLNKVNKLIAPLDYKKIMNKLVNNLMNSFLKPFEKTFSKLKNNPLKKIDLVLEKWNQKFFQKFGQASYKSIDKLLIPIDSIWLWAYRIKPLISGTYALMIHFKKRDKEPEVFHLNANEMQLWVKACEEHKADHYYRAKLNSEYQLKTPAFLNALNVLPPIVEKFIVEGLQIDNYLKKNRKNIKSINPVVSQLEKNLSIQKIKKLDDYLFSISFSSVYFRTTFHDWISKDSNIKYAKNILNLPKRKSYFKEIKKI